MTPGEIEDLADAISGDAKPIRWFRRQNRKKKVLFTLALLENVFCYVAIAGLVTMVAKARVELKQCRSRPNSIYQP